MTYDQMLASQYEWVEGLHLERNAPVPLWEQILSLLTARIKDGELKPGEQLPPEHTLATHLGVNRHTIRRAFGELETRGLLHIERGRGTFVHEGIRDQKATPQPKLTIDLSKENKEPTGTIVKMSSTIPPDSAIKVLGMTANEPAIWFRRLIMVDQRPVGLSDHYYPLKQFQGFIEIYKQRQSVAATYAYFGIFDFCRKNIRVTACMPSVEEMELLKLPRNHPVLTSEAVSIDADGFAIEYGRAVYHGAAVEATLGVKAP